MADADDKHAAGPGSGAPAGEGPAAPPQPPPPPEPPAVPPGFVFHGPPPPARRWGSRPVQLLVAGLVGALIGGGLVGAMDVLDDDGDDRRLRVSERGIGPDGPGRHRWERGGEDGFERLPPEFRGPRRVFPPEPVPSAPASPSPSPTD